MKAKNCECCYMPMAKDPKDSGSDKFCSYCFVNGKLVAEGMSQQEFMKRTHDIMLKEGMGKFKAWFFLQFVRIAPYWKARAKG